MEIKFRGKRMDNGQTVYGGYHKHMRVMECPIDSPEPLNVVHMIISDGFADWNMPVPIEGYQVEAESVEVYLGDDSNDEEIWVNMFSTRKLYQRF